MNSKVTVAVLLFLLCFFSKNGFSEIYRNKGLRGLRGWNELSYEEREQFKNSVYRDYAYNYDKRQAIDAFDNYQWEVAYNTSNSKNTFGEDAFKQVKNPYQRDAMYRSYVINKALENEFGRETEEIQIIQSLNLYEQTLIELLEFKNDELLSQIYVRAGIKRLESSKDVIQGMGLYRVFKEKKPFDDRHISKEQMAEWLSEYLTLEELKGVTVARRHFGSVLHEHIAKCQTWYRGWLSQTMCNLATEVLELVINPLNMIRALKTGPHYRLTMTCFVTGRDANGHKLDGWDWTNPNCLEFARGAGSISPNYLLKIKQYNECRW